MAQKIIDLDEFAGTPLKVKLQGKTYKLPGDIPIPVILRMQALAEDAAVEDEDAGRRLYEEVLALFKVFQPELTEVPLEPAQLTQFVPAVYGGGEEAAAAPEGAEGATPSSGTKSSSKPTPKSPSAKSSAP